ncbi:MAG TPA: hypothetical protein VD886_12725, partial [Herpetosiphonaceae bacterium]|nr:hypothetical protein [Herpetosiphonaceae bacterium]
LSADELAALVAITDGNPLYVQESLAGERRAPQPFRQVIAERMAGLGAEALDALYAAAVLGREWPAALWQAFAERPIAELAGELEAARLIQAAGAGYAFRHDLIHQHVAAAIPPERERALHTRAVERLAGSGAGPERLGWHAERAGDHGAAIGWYRAAAEAALAAFAYSTALDHTERALALLDGAPPDPAARLALLCVRQRVLGIGGRIAGWRADVDAIERLALELEHPPARLEALEARITLLSVDSQVEPMRAVAEEAARLAESLGQLTAQARIWRSYAFNVILAAASPPADTLPMLERSVTLAERQGDAATQVASLCTLAFAECMMGRTSQAHSHAAQALTLIELYPELYPARGDVLRVLAEAALNRADWETARATMHKAIHLLEEQDEKWTLGAALFMAVYVFGGMGQHAEARAAVARLSDMLRFGEIDPYSNWSLYTYTVAIDCALQAGDLAAAEAVVQRHRAWLDGAPKSGAALYLLTEVGALRLFQNRPREALEYLRQALPLWFAARSGFLPLLLTHALAAQIAGEAAEAARSMSVAEEHYASHEIAYCAVLFHFTRFWVRGSADDLQAAHQAMHDQAERIRDEALRQAFLEEVRLHKMLALLWRVRPLAGTLRSLAGLWLRITQVYAPAPAGASAVQVMLARVGAPLGKTLGADERVGVRWTLHAPEDDL